jgi:hypothetical protein
MRVGSPLPRFGRTGRPNAVSEWEGCDQAMLISMGSGNRMGWRYLGLKPAEARWYGARAPHRETHRKCSLQSSLSVKKNTSAYLPRLARTVLNGIKL